MAHEGTSTLLIDASPEALFAVVTDLDSYPEWLTDVKEVEILGTTPDGFPTASTMRVDVSIRVVTYILDYEYDYPQRVSWRSRPGGDVKLIEGSYEFLPTTDGSTEVVYQLAIDPGFPVPGFLVKRAAKHITRQALDGLAEQVAGQ